MPEGRYWPTQTRLGPTPLNTRGLRLGRWKLTRYSTGEAELYDLASDPLELRNLAHGCRGTPRCWPTLRQLYRRYADCGGQAPGVRPAVAPDAGGVG